MTTADAALMTDYLIEQGHSRVDVARMLVELREHDSRTMRESVFDSIERGGFDLREIVAHALKPDTVDAKDENNER